MKKIVIGALFILVGLFNQSVQAEDAVVGPGKKVSLEYTLFVNNEQVETSVGSEPLTYAVGDNSIIPGLESQLNGMHAGEEKEVMVSAKDGYGDKDPGAFKEFPKDSLPKDAEAKVGMVLQATSPDGENFPAVVSEIKDDKVVLDFNHPLAGKELKFKVKILDIKDAPAVAEEEVKTLEQPAAAESPAKNEQVAESAPAVANGEAAPAESK